MGQDDRENEIERFRKRSAALARFGSEAVRTHDIDALLREACTLVSESMNIRLVKVLELQPDGETLLVRAGVNWKPGVVGRATLRAHEHSPAGHALEHERPVISRDTAREQRFDIPALLVEHGVRSMINVVIRGEHAPWGVLEVDAPEPRDFSDDDIAFLQNYANLLAAAIDRLRREAELREEARRRALLFGELQHRVRNMLMNVRALAQRTLRTSGDLEAFAAAFDARLLALGRTHEMLVRGTAEPITLEEALRQELLAHGAEEGERVRLRGPRLVVAPRVAQALALAFHELATNSVKYGALSRPGASLTVEWTASGDTEDGEIAIRWREHGVPIDGPPDRRGFGSETIEQSLPHMLGGAAELVFHPDGLECALRFPTGSGPDERRDPA